MVAGRVKHWVESWKLCGTDRRPSGVLEMLWVGAGGLEGNGVCRGDKCGNGGALIEEV